MYSSYVIDDQTPMTETHDPKFKRGLIPRNFETHPIGFYRSAPPFDMPLIPRNEYLERIKEQAANRMSLVHIRERGGPGGGRIPSLDQDGIGYCWTHDPTMAVMLTRAQMNEPYVRLSAFMVGCLLTNYHDDGGWAAKAADFIASNGVPSVDFWPEKSMDPKYDNADMRANAAKHKIVAMWADMGKAQYDRNLTEDQKATSLLTNRVVCGDLNWWGHSVALLAMGLTAKALAPGFTPPDLSSLDLTNSRDLYVYDSIFNTTGINSWTDDYGDNGLFTLAGSKQHIDGGVAVRAVNPSDN